MFMYLKISDVRGGHSCIVSDWTVVKRSWGQVSICLSTLIAGNKQYSDIVSLAELVTRSHLYRRTSRCTKTLERLATAHGQ